MEKLDIIISFCWLTVLLALVCFVGIAAFHAENEVNRHYKALRSYDASLCK